MHKDFCFKNLFVFQLPLQDILTAMFPQANVTEETEVIVTSPQYLIEVSYIVASSDRVVLNSYLIWTLVKSYLPYLSSQFATVIDTFNSEVFGEFFSPLFLQIYRMVTFIMVTTEISKIVKKLRILEIFQIIRKKGIRNKFSRIHFT